MIRLHRGPEPQFLKDNKAAWTARFNSNPPPADWASAGAKKQIKAELQKFSFGKCAFCEGCPDETGFSEIEHYHAKSLYRHLAFEWTNLLFSCRRCNHSKSGHDHQGALIKPDEEDPEELFWLNLDSGKLEPQDGLDPQQRKRVEDSIEICDLNRGESCSARLRVWKMAKQTLNRLGLEAADPPAEALDDMRELLKPPQLYKFAVRFALAREGRHELLQKDKADFEAASRPE